MVMMKCHTKVAVFLLVSILSFAGRVNAGPVEAEVIEVLNSFSFKVAVNDEVKIVRLAEIICPRAIFNEFPCEERARTFLHEKTSGKKITLIFWAVDAVGRSVCEAILPDGSSLGRLLVAKGYALQDRYFSSSSELRDLELLAKSQKLGVWEHLSGSL